MSNLIKNSHFVQLFVLKTLSITFMIRDVESNTKQQKIFDSKVSSSTYTHSPTLIHT
jgi:hypothetical protein